MRAELQRDLVGIWMLSSRVNAVIPELDAEGVRGAVLDVIERALRDGEAEAATSEGGQLEAWSGSAAEIRQRVETEWRALGRDPLPSEVLWLQKPGGWPPRSPPADRADSETHRAYARATQRSS
jgi:hypothetical protein